MEKILKIQNIEGKLNTNTTPEKKQNKKVIIFVHGLGGRISEHIFVAGTQFFTEKGIDCFRFKLYQHKDLDQCSLYDHVEMINTVSEYFSEHYKEVYLVGHSLGAPCILLSNQFATKMVFWDGWNFSHDKVLKDFIDNEIKIIDGKKYLNWGTNILMSEKMLEEFENIKNLEKKFKIPCKCITASEGTIKKGWLDIWDTISVQKEYKEITGAKHVFCDEGVDMQLFEETLKFIV